MKSKTQTFIDDITENPNSWEGRLSKISELFFREEIARTRSKGIPFYKLETYLHDCDIKPHPMLKVYETVDSQTDYPSGGSDYIFVFLFYYKGQHYEYCECGGT